jgi:hypothetical protein
METFAWLPGAEHSRGFRKLKDIEGMSRSEIIKLFWMRRHAVHDSNMVRPIPPPTVISAPGTSNVVKSPLLLRTKLIFAQRRCILTGRTWINSSDDELNCLRARYAARQRK